MKKKISMMLILLIISINLVSCISIKQKQTNEQRKDIVYGVTSIPQTLGLDVDLKDRENDLICCFYLKVC